MSSSVLFGKFSETALRMGNIQVEYGVNREERQREGNWLDWNIKHDRGDLHDYQSARVDHWAVRVNLCRVKHRENQEQRIDEQPQLAEDQGELQQPGGRWYPCWKVNNR